MPKLTREELMAALKVAPVLWSYRRSVRPRFVLASRTDTYDAPTVYRWPVSDVAHLIEETKVGKYQKDYRYYRLQNASHSCTSLAAADDQPFVQTPPQQNSKLDEKQNPRNVTCKTITLDITKRAVRAYNEEQWPDTDSHGVRLVRSNLHYLTRNGFLNCGRLTAAMLGAITNCGTKCAIAFRT